MKQTEITRINLSEARVEERLAFDRFVELCNRLQRLRDLELLTQNEVYDRAFKESQTVGEKHEFTEYLENLLVEQSKDALNLKFGV